MVFRLLDYIDEVLVPPSPYEVVSDIEAYQNVTLKVSALVEDLGLRRSLKKRKWFVVKLVEHLCIIIDYVAMNYSVKSQKVYKIRIMERKMCEWLRTEEDGQM